MTVWLVAGIAICTCLSELTKGELICACTTPGCTLAGADICKADQFCYSKLRSAVKAGSPQPIEKGCAGEQKTRCRDSPVSLMDTETYLVCCSTHWCNSPTPDKLPALTASGLQTRSPLLPKVTLRPAVRPYQRPASTSSPTPKRSHRPTTKSYNFAASTSSASAPMLPQPFTARRGFVTPWPVIHRQQPDGVRQSRRPAGANPSDLNSSQISDLVHPVYIAVPVMSLCLIVTALAALVLVIRRREQLDCPNTPRRLPMEHQQQQQQQQQFQRQQQQQQMPQQQQYNLQYRDSLVTQQATMAHTHMFTRYQQSRKPLLSCSNGVGSVELCGSCQSNLNELVA